MTYLAVSLNSFLCQMCQIMLKENTTIVCFCFAKCFPLGYTILNSGICYINLQNKLLKSNGTYHKVMSPLKSIELVKHMIVLNFKL